MNGGGFDHFLRHSSKSGDGLLELKETLVTSLRRKAGMASTGEAKGKVPEVSQASGVDTAAAAAEGEGSVGRR